MRLTSELGPPKLAFSSNLRMSQATKIGVTNRGGIQRSRVVRASLGTTWKTIRT